MTKQELRKKWIAALRSGQYKQCKGTLKTVDDKGVVRHCCLGVLCEITGTKERVVDGYHYFGDRDDVLPASVARKVGLRYSDGLSNSKRYMGLAELNDKGKTFKQIADLLEKYPKRYFGEYCD